MTYLDHLRDLGYLTAEPQEAPTFTVEEDGTLVMEWQEPRLAVRLTAATVDGLGASLDDARRREAEALIDDDTIWPA